MRKLFDAVKIVLAVCLVSCVCTGVAFARYSSTANFKKAERNALRNGITVGGVTYSVVGGAGGTVVVGSSSINSYAGGYASGKAPTFVDIYTASLKEQGLLQNGVGYNADLLIGGHGPPYQIEELMQAFNLSGCGNVYTGSQQCNYVPGSSPGFYFVTVCGSSSSSCYNNYYPIGTGPNPTARSGDAIGAPPPPPGTVQARAVTMATIPQTCDQIKEATASTTFRSGTQFDLKLGTVSQGVKTQSGSDYVSWSLQPNTYTLTALSPGTSSVRYCLTDATGSHFGVSTVNLASSVTDTFDVAYGPPPAWFQAQGGDVYAAANISALTPSGASPRQFLLSGTGGYPGVVTYGGASTDYDFSSDDGTKGEAYVSSKNWLANDGAGNRDFYSYFYSKLGSPTTPDYTNLTDPLPQPASDSGKPIYVQGNMTTSGDWTVADGQKYVFLVDGALTIGGHINITGNGFIAFIVKNDITIASGVGGVYTSTAPAVEGIYLSSGTIHTGASSVAGAERLVGRGMFVANHVALERDLNSLNQNGTYAAELFIYNPALLINLPDTMKNVPVSWQEVAP